MMFEHEDFYTPESIDQQVDTLLQARTMPDQDQRMVQDLHIVLAHADADTDAQSLQRVLHRLLEGEHSTLKQNNESIFSSEQMHQRKDGKIIRMQEIASTKKTGSMVRVFSTLVATLIVAVLIGSILIFTHAAPQKNGSASTISGATHSTPTSTSTVPQGIYASNPSTVFRLDIRQKKEVIWQQALADVAKIVPAGKVVYILQGSMQGTAQNQDAVLELDANTGKILWKHVFSGQGIPTDLELAQNQLYVVGADTTTNSSNYGDIDVLNASNGDLLPFVYAHVVTEDVEVNGDILAVGGNNGIDSTGLQVYNASTHKILWQVSIPDSSKGTVSIKIVNNLIYAVFSSDDMDRNSGKSYIVVYQAATGRQIWQSSTFSGQALSDVTINQNTIYFNAANTSTLPFTGKMYAYNILSNKQLWSTSVDGNDLASLVFSNGMLYTILNQGTAASYAHMIAINATTGKIKWQQTLDIGVSSSFSISNGILYVGYSNGISPSGSRLIAFSADSGQKVWEETGKYGSGTQVATE